jgi:hypothetical protein
MILITETIFLAEIYSPIPVECFRRNRSFRDHVPSNVARVAHLALLLKWPLSVLSVSLRGFTATAHV